MFEKVMIELLHLYIRNRKSFTVFFVFFPEKKFTFRYDNIFYGVRPDILISIESTNPHELTNFLLVETACRISEANKSDA